MTVTEQGDQSEIPTDRSAPSSGRMLYDDGDDFDDHQASDPGILRKRLDAAVKEAVEAFDLRPERFEMVSIESRVQDRSLTPLGVPIIMNAIFCVGVAVVAAYEAVSIQTFSGLTPLQRWETFAFLVCNNPAIGQMLCASFARVHLRPKERKAIDYVFALLPVVILLPTLPFIVTGLVVGFPVHLAVVIVTVGFPGLIRLYRKRRGKASSYFLRMFHRMLILLAVMFILSASFNYSAMFVFRGSSGTFLDSVDPNPWIAMIVADDLHRSTVCTLEHTFVPSVSASSVAMMLSLLPLF